MRLDNVCIVKSPREKGITGQMTTAKRQHASGQEIIKRKASWCCEYCWKFLN